MNPRRNPPPSFSKPPAPPAPPKAQPEIAAFLLGGPFGVVLAMYLLHHLHRQPEGTMIGIIKTAIRLARTERRARAEVDGTAILAKIQSGMTVRQAFDAVLGDGAYSKIAGELEGALRAALTQQAERDALHAEIEALKAEREILKQEAAKAWREVDFIAKERTEHLEWRTKLANDLDECERMRDALLSLIADDAFAASFQSLAQYRSALLKATKGGGNG